MSYKLYHWFKSASLLKKIFSIFLLFIVILAVGRSVQLYKDTLYHGVRAPYLQSLSSDSVIIRWQTREPGPGKIRLGTDINSLNTVFVAPGISEEHEVLITSLKPATRYYYYPEHFASPSTKPFSFVTAPETGSSSAVRFWVLGDPGYKGEAQDQVRDSMLDWIQQHSETDNRDLSFIVTTGDNAYRSGTNKQFQKSFFTPYEALLSQYAIWPAYGNHDARRRTFFNVFSLPEHGEAGGIPSGTEHYFSFDYANVHVVMLDTFEKDELMLDWLEKDLKAQKQKWLIAIFHHPAYSKGHQDSDDASDSRGRLFFAREKVLPILQKYNVDLVLSGHSHSYERSHLVDCHYGESDSLKPDMILDKGQKTKDGLMTYTKTNDNQPHQGTIFAVVGSSAKLNPDVPLNHPVMDVSLATYGSLLVDIEGNQLTAHFIDDKGQQRDAFSLIKSSTKSASTQCSAH